MLLNVTKGTLKELYYHINDQKREAGSNSASAIDPMNPVLSTLNLLVRTRPDPHLVLQLVRAAVRCKQQGTLPTVTTCTSIREPQELRRRVLRERMWRLTLEDVSQETGEMM